MALFTISSPAYLTAVVSLLLYLAYRAFSRNSKYTTLPTVGPKRTFLEWATNSFRPFNSSWGEVGYETFMAPAQEKGSTFEALAFRVPASYGYSTVLPPELLQEYSQMGHDMVDFMAPPRDVGPG